MAVQFARVAACSVLFSLIAADVNAGYRMCALREGPKGPCSCQAEGDEPGQFRAVSRKLCRTASPKAPAAAAPASRETGLIETGTTTPALPSPQPAPESAPSAPTVLSSATVEKIRMRGRLLCGVNDGLLGFSLRDSTGIWTGLDTDFCRAVAAAVTGDGTKVDFVPVGTLERFDVLAEEKVDLLARNTTWTMSRDVDMGFDFAGVLYYDGQGFLTGSERGLVSAQQLSGAKVCVESGTTTAKNMDFYFKAAKIEAEVQAFDTRDGMIKAYQDGTCEAYSADASALYAERAQFPDPEAHAILPEVISKEPLGPLVKGGDPVWTEIVRWTLAGLINAEEIGFDRQAARSTGPLSDDAARLVSGAGSSGEKLGLSPAWLKTVIAEVGNYGEMFEANVGKGSPIGMKRGLNALWKRGGILYAPPMW